MKSHSSHHTCMLMSPLGPSVVTLCSDTICNIPRIPRSQYVQRRENYYLFIYFTATTKESQSR